MHHFLLYFSNLKRCVVFFVFWQCILECVFSLGFGRIACQKWQLSQGSVWEGAFPCVFGAVEARLLEPGAFFVCLQSKNGTCHVVSLESIDV